MTIYVDHTHLGRHVTGLERITIELFSESALAPLNVVPLTAHGTGQMIATQTFGLPLKLAQASSVLLCPGFPPSPLLRPFAARVLPYFHDDFLISRHQDLNVRARLYMAAPFRLALRNYPRFLTNSATTRNRLMKYSRPDASITLYRPTARNVFDVSHAGRAERTSQPAPLRLITLGTVEPRKNLLAAGRILLALHDSGFTDATLDVIGRRGWGNDWDTLEKIPGVRLRGYQPAGEVTELLQQADIYICTSHDEGLGLPLLEVQHAGLPVVAPDADVFREVLGDSGIFIDSSRPDDGARKISELIRSGDWRARYVQLARMNLARWNALAAADRDHVIDVISRMERQSSADLANSPQRHATR